MHSTNTVFRLRLAGLLLACAAGAPAALTMSGCTTNEATGRSQFLMMSREEEVALGAQAQPQLTQEFGGEVPDAQLNAYVDNIGRRLAAHTEGDNPSLPWEFTLLDSAVINAFALPGGKVFFSRGLAEKCTNEAQMAAVVGHEIGHVTARHGNERQGQSLWTAIGGAALGAIGGYAVGGEEGIGTGAAVGGSVGGIVALSYSRDQEMEADRLGMRYMEREKYHPLGAVQVQEILLREGGGGGQFDWLATHPSGERRVKALDEILKDQYAHTINNPEYSLYEERYRTQFLARLEKLPPPKHTAMTEADREFLKTAKAFVAEDPSTWCGICREKAER